MITTPWIFIILAIAAFVGLLIAHGSKYVPEESTIPNTKFFTICGGCEQEMTPEADAAGKCNVCGIEYEGDFAVSSTSDLEFVTLYSDYPDDDNTGVNCGVCHGEVSDFPDEGDIVKCPHCGAEYGLDDHLTPEWVAKLKKERK